MTIPSKKFLVMFLAGFSVGTTYGSIIRMIFIEKLVRCAFKKKVAIEISKHRKNREMSENGIFWNYNDSISNFKTVMI